MRNMVRVQRASMEKQAEQLDSDDNLYEEGEGDENNG
jgi:hypothetical protein